MQTLTPMVSWALTSGPAQPEAKQFAQAGTTDFVDLATGNFKYNIPLMDVDGYPLSLNYQSGSGMDEEASWVGYGWNLNVGAVNRQLRGIADDSYADTVWTDNYVKPKITIGGSLTDRVEVAGIGKSIKVSGTFSRGIHSDNYTGIGADLTGNVGLSLSVPGASYLTPGVGIGITSSSSDGVTVNPSLSVKVLTGGNTVQGVGLSGNMAWNTRDGLKTLTLKTTFNNDVYDHIADWAYSATWSYSQPAFYPKANMNFTSHNFTFSSDVGGSYYLLYGGGGVTGYKTKREVANQKQMNKAYGFMYAETGKNNPTALMDFMREKDNPVIFDLKNLAVPIATPDIFSYTSQADGGQFRLFRNQSGVFFDNQTQDLSNNTSASVEAGVGGYFHGGTSVYKQNINTTVGKWTMYNAFLSDADFPVTNVTGEEDVYFKQAGETAVEDPAFYNSVQGEDAVNVQFNGKQALDRLKKGTTVFTPTGNYKRNGRQIKKAPVMPLLAGEMVNMGGGDSVLYNYDFNVFNQFTPYACNALVKSKESRVNRFRKSKHISEIIKTTDDGKRLVYGMPVYNKKQVEVSYATNTANLTANTKKIKLVTSGGVPTHKPTTNGKSISDEYYTRQEQPGYATSWLLTEVLSPDYVDVTNDGITEDDRGTAYKFNYSKVDKDFQWRTPYGDSAQYNPGLRADPDDDKGSYVFGTKELRYLHSVESKTMIAYFITEDRDDALGYDSLGVLDTVVKQKRLKEIRLYAKNDLNTPIKTVKFGYSYNLFGKVPNNVNGGGKLTLDTLYYTYGSSTRGKDYYYLFDYNNDHGYGTMMTDRWGTLKRLTENSQKSIALGNDEFPYTTQDHDVAAIDAGMWQLKEIQLPTGGKVSVDYEADDYAYVQNRRSMVMSKITGMKTGPGGSTTTSLRDAKTFLVSLDSTAVNVPTDATERLKWFKDKYLDGSDYMYMKMFVNVTDAPTSTDDSKFDFVPVYAAVSEVTVSGATAEVTFKVDNDGGKSVNPVISAAWQRMRMDYQRYAYPGYINRITDDLPVITAVKAIASSITTLSELWENFNEKAYRKKFASIVKLEKSFARVVNMTGKKLGGGLRVKSVRLSDQWNTMATDQDAAIYGQQYDYTIIEDGKAISSGVTSYEPSNGGDENPMRMPVKYTQDVKWGLNNYFYLEEPMGESLFPAPEVVYRQVTVRNLTSDGTLDTKNKTGWTTAEFYTAKEFPVIVQQTAIDKFLHNPNSWASFFGGKSTYELAMSQGYSIILNDMHGKPKAERVFNQSGHEVSANEYYYNTTGDGGTMRLSNVVDVVDANGNITTDQVIGRDIEMFTDMRESEMSNTGTSINLGADVIPIWGYPVPIPHWPKSSNEDYRLFRSSCVAKTIQYTGILNKTIKRLNGSQIESKTLLYDRNTGAPVLTQSQNEFDDPVYNVSIPAYWMYKQMGMAYQNLGMLMKDFNIVGSAIPSQYLSFLSPGDELVDLYTGVRLWVINSPTSTSTTPAIRIISQSGRTIKDYSGTMKVFRSGYRNQLGAAATTMTLLKNPVSGGRLKIISNEELAGYNVINASAVLYSDAWGQPAVCESPNSCPDGYTETADGTQCYFKPTETSGFELQHGDKNANYGNRGAFFFEPTAEGHYYNSTATYWMGCAAGCGRLSEAGVWMTSRPVHDWWGVEKCIEIKTAGVYFIGYAADNVMRVYIDNKLLQPQFRGDSRSYYQAWRIRKKYLAAGKHIIRMDAANAGDVKAAAVEVYGSSEATLMAGDAQTIEDEMIFSSKTLVGDKNALLFYTDGDGNRGSKNYRCDNGMDLNLCDGTPNCGYKPKQACPDGYVLSADGQACTTPMTINNDTSLQIRTGYRNPTYSQWGALFFNSSGQVVDSIRNDPFWGYRCDGVDPDEQGTGGYIPPDDQGSLDSVTTSSVVTASAARVAKVTSDSSTSLRAMVASVSSSINYTTGCGRLNATSVWLRENFAQKWIGMNFCVKVPVGKQYYIGYGVDNHIRIYIDGMLWKEHIMEDDDADHRFYSYWQVRPRYLSAGNHIFTIEAMNVVSASGFLDRAVGMEIYNNTIPQLKNYQLDTIFTTNQLLNPSKPYDTYVKDTAGNILYRHYTCGQGAVNICDDAPGCLAIPAGNVLNPYLTGYLGNWLMYKEMTWLSDRSGQDLPDNTSGAVNIRQNGQYTTFYPFWYYNGGWEMSTNTGWVTNTTTTMYDETSQALESKDALNQYSSVRFGFKNKLPLAVGVNMRQREIFYDGFDDYMFNSGCNTALTCRPDQFNIRRKLGDAYADALDTENAHSGNYSLKLDSSITLTTYIYSQEHEPGIYLKNNLWGEYYKGVDGWLGLRDWAPVTGRKYIFSAWVHVSDPYNTSPSLRLQWLHNLKSITLQTKAIVDGWKLVEGTLDVANEVGATDMTSFGLKISRMAADESIDDIRIFPYDGQLKSYAYNDKNMRLMAEMDENNYATFYEYDEEGALIRVKKETERGIMTIKENRSTYRKR
ncbi:hypothetical protein [Chitinophaga sp.]|uniref:hypothetical protein n=1 Tax=Chitinophaga sp. TaxID=1869181 RepID=UPI0031E158CA